MQSTQQGLFPSKLIHFLTFFSTKRVILIILTLGLTVFANALFNGYVADDSVFIFNNPNIHNFNIAYLFGPNPSNAGSYYRPISAVYFSFLYNLFGAQVFFYHLSQVILHIVNTILLYFLFRSIFNKILFTNPSINLLSLFLSLIFLVHPINVASVAYIASSQSELFFLFGIIAILTSFKENNLKNLFLISLFLLLSILTKETGILFLVMVLGIQVFFKRYNVLKSLIFQSIALGIYFFIRFAIGGVFFTKFIGVYTIPPIQNLSLMDRVANIPKIILYYLTATFFPLKLVFFQQWVIPTVNLENFYIPFILDSLFFLVLFLTGIYIYKYKRGYFNKYLFFFFWFILGLFMLLQIFPLTATAEDRWFYFPLVGILGMLGVGLQTLLISDNQRDNFRFKYEKAKTVIILIGISIILVLSLRTIVRNADYHDDITLLSHDVQLEDNYILEAYLGVAYQLSGDKQLAMVHLKKSVSLHPFSYNLFCLGLLYEFEGNYQKAGEFYHKAIIAADEYNSLYHQRFQFDEKIYVRYALLLLANKEYDETSVVLKKGLQYYPKSSILWVELATNYYAQKDQKDAISALTKAKSLASNDLLNSIDSLIANKQYVDLSFIAEYAQKQIDIELNTGTQ